ncbi:MAG: PrsW family glutamic-type intramembrane protease [Bacteroidota bacterium]|nr:PrsW family glutamic-type intramembrane protease [Bacteroidota bacterium]
MMAANIVFGLTPIFIFLTALILLDSFKLVKLRSILQVIIIGSLIALVAYGINTIAMNELRLNATHYSRYVSPFIEEILKASFIIFLIQSRKIGFMVDAALFGMAVGAGFAFTENIFYLLHLSDNNILLWLIRGFGTALMHGGATAIFGIVARSMFDTYPNKFIRAFVPGLLLSIIIHSFFNHFIFSPVILTVLIIILLPVLMLIIFKRSEEITRTWLGKGLDSDLELLNLIMTGNLPDSKIGAYLHLLKSRFPPEVVGDMLCYIRICTELGMRAKGLLLMREAGYDVPIDAETSEKFDELKFLEKSIGPTGKLAISPVLHISGRSLWQLNLLEK